MSVELETQIPEENAGQPFKMTTVVKEEAKQATPPEEDKENKQALTDQIAEAIREQKDLEAFAKELPDPNSTDDGEAPKGFWLSDDPNVVVTIYVYKNVDTKEMTYPMLEPMSLDRRKLLRLVEMPVTAEFSLPDRDQLDRYRERSSRWNDEAQALLVSRFTLRRLILRHHLQTIDLLDSKTKEPIKLTHVEGGKRLSPESENLLSKLHPTLMDTIMLKFERVANLIY